MEMRNPQDAKSAYESMNGFEIAGQLIQVGWVNEKSGFGNGAVVSFADSSLDDVDESGGGMRGVSRTELMAKLASKGDMTFPGRPSDQLLKQRPPSPPAAVKPAAQPTRNCLLKNMFNPLEETELNWDAEIRDDVIDECEKFGKILHIHVDKSSPEGKVFLRFDSVDSCKAAVQALNGRWFAKKQIIATFIVDGIYETQFPETRL